MSLSVVCLRPGRRELVPELVSSGVVDELHLDYFTAAPHDSVGLESVEVRELANSGVPATIHLWGSADDLLGLHITPREGLRVVVEQEKADDVRTADLLEAAGWATGWSIAAGEWRTAAVKMAAAVNPPRFVQVLSTTTPGRPGGHLAPDTADAVDFFATDGHEVSVDGGLTGAAILGLAGASMVVLGTNFLGVGRGRLLDLPHRLEQLKGRG